MLTATKGEESQGFGNVFGGYCVIHSPQLNPDRRAGFERELKRVGVTNYHLIEPEFVSEDEPRIAPFKNAHNPRASLSLILTHIKCIQFARRRRWESVVICEDDVCFRPQFTRIWQEVEEKVLKTNWDVLYPYFWYKRIREPRGPVNLKPINDTCCTHCYMVQASCFDAMEEALRHLMELGLAVDDWHLHHRLIKNGKIILATTKNLVGQSASARSTSTNFARINFVEDIFNIWNPNPLGTLAWFLTKAAIRLWERVVMAGQWVKNKAEIVERRT